MKDILFDSKSGILSFRYGAINPKVVQPLMTGCMVPESLRECTCSVCVLTEYVGAKRLFGAVLATASKSKQREGDVIQITLLEIGHWMAHSPTFPLFIHK